VEARGKRQSRPSAYEAVSISAGADSRRLHDGQPMRSLPLARLQRPPDGPSRPLPVDGAATTSQPLLGVQPVLVQDRQHCQHCEDHELATWRSTAYGYGSLAGTLRKDMAGTQVGASLAVVTAAALPAHGAQSFGAPRVRGTLRSGDFMHDLSWLARPSEPREHEMCCSRPADAHSRGFNSRLCWNGRPTHDSYIEPHTCALYRAADVLVMHCSVC